MAMSILLSVAFFFATALAQNSSPEDSGSNAGSSGSQSSSHIDNEGGASGASSGYNLSKGGVVAIVVVCALVAIFGIASATLFYIAKKRQWEVRKTIKRASRRVVSKVNPRQSRHQSRPRGMVRMQSPSRMRNVDLEKGNMSKSSTKGDGRAKREPLEIDDTQTSTSHGVKSSQTKNEPLSKK
ncbi:MAG: hypothetical protein Q9162_003322 [Coniocarpon cinnabarinum]